MTKPAFAICEQQRRRSACVAAQSLIPGTPILLNWMRTVRKVKNHYLQPYNNHHFAHPCAFLDSHTIRTGCTSAICAPTIIAICGLASLLQTQETSGMKMLTSFSWWCCRS